MKIKLLVYLAFGYVIAVALTSCGLPVKASFIGDYGVYSYSSKSGIEIQINIEK